jgi:hypothetical protein
MLSFRLILLAGVYVVSTMVFPISCKSRVTTNPTATSIIKIAYSSTGGRGGNYESLSISADSLIYLQARRGNEQTIHEITPTGFWHRLTASINLNDFNKIRSNPGHALYDGIDSTLSIQVAGGTYTVVNGNEDTANYGRIRPFTRLLENKLAELRKRITQ